MTFTEYTFIAFACSALGAGAVYGALHAVVAWVVL